MKTSYSGIKILYITPYFVPAWSYGGPVKVSYEFAKGLVQLGNQVTVVTTDALDRKSRNDRSYEEIDGIKVFRFKNLSNTLAKSFNFYIPIGFARWLKKNLNDYDIVHIHEFFTLQSIIGSRMCEKHKKPYVIQPHGSLSGYAKNSRFKFLKKIIIKHLAKIAFSSQAVIVLTKKEKANVSETYPEIKSKIKIVANGINPKELKEIKKVDLHRIYNIPKENRIIAYLGRIHFQKGLDRVINALSFIKKRSEITFLIIGPDEGEKNNLINLAEKLGIENQIIFTGMMTGKKKLETLKGADLSILLSRSEGLPTTLLESAGLGLPIICSHESNLPEVKIFGAGLVVSNRQEAVSSIERILNDKESNTSMSKNALSLAESFDIEKQVVKLTKIYDSSL